jgi:hypothetical protein
LGHSRRDWLRATIGPRPLRPKSGSEIRHALTTQAAALAKFEAEPNAGAATSAGDWAGNANSARSGIMSSLRDRLLGKYFCNDCGVDVLALGDWYMCPDTVWEEELGLGWSDNLCITCLVKRLGRDPQSFTDIFPANAGGIALNELVPLSDRLLQIMRPKTNRKK